MKDHKSTILIDFVYLYPLKYAFSMPIVADSWYSDRINSLPKSDLGRFGWHQRGEAGDSSDGLCDFALRE